MSELPRLGMTDVASSSGAGRVRWLGFGLLALLLGYCIVRNTLYVLDGMLAPNFALIQKAYDFNLMELPLLLLSGGLIFFFLAAVWGRARRSLIGFALLYVFFAVDLFVLRYYVTHVEPRRLVLRTVRLETPKLSAPVRILHISDIQAGSIGAYEREIFRRIQALDPDLILNTGDYLQEVAPATFDSEFPKLVELIRTLDPPLGHYGVFGDTELELHRVPPEELAPLQLLSSGTATIETAGGRLSLHGLSLFQSQKADWAARTVETWLEGSEEADFRILMGHSPDYAMGVGDWPIDLCLAGHTHGGQVRVPFFGPLTTYSDAPKEWSRGFRRIGYPYLNVSAGVGSNRRNGLPPIRFNCPTEMTLIELVPVVSVR
ncbi:MAG: metallophosphoesterase [Opitutales bacterium]